MTTVPEPNPVEVWCVVLYLDIESRAIAGRVDRQHLFSLSVGITKFKLISGPEHKSSASPLGTGGSKFMTRKSGDVQLIRDLTGVGPLGSQWIN
ncbi:hypothetical protein TNCV_1677931 [Trichonephila clavipes]|nr:hypothetical protein TNCV_1677931 [Trichonephila clavipes]